MEQILPSVLNVQGIQNRGYLTCLPLMDINRYITMEGDFLFWPKSIFQVEKEQSEKLKKAKLKIDKKITCKN